MTKAQAETQKTQAEAKKFEAETRRAKAEATKFEHEARRELCWAQREEIDLNRKREEEEERLASDDHHRVYRFIGEVTASTAKLCMAQLSTWQRIDLGCDIEIVFNSPGGDVTSGLALFDLIQETRRAGHHVTTSTVGYAASMAGILLQAGDLRVMSKESWLLIHQASFGAVGSFGEVEDRVKWIERIQERILDIFAARSIMPKAQIKKNWHRRDWWISSDEALKHGFVDEVR